MHDELRRILNESKFDIIQLESLFMAPYIDTIRKYSSAKVVLRAHNVEYRIWERLAQSIGSPIKKWYLNLLAKRLKKYECSVLNKFDGIVALTKDDENLFRTSGCTIPVFVSPIGLDTNNYNFSPSNTGLQSVFHLGSMDWLPNIEAIDWFIENVFPLLVPDSHTKKYSIYLAGKNMPDRFFKLNSDNLIVSGRVDDAKGFMVDKQIMIVPLLSGGGMRVKIIEGMAMGKTIISTTIGAEGIQYENGKNILIANTPSEFSMAILKCITDTDFCLSTGASARLLAIEKYDNHVVGSGVLEFYNTLQAEHKSLTSTTGKS
jgi:glycosyltransferase involved in cell wall biosynthesis